MKNFKASSAHKYACPPRKPSVLNSTRIRCAAGHAKHLVQVVGRVFIVYLFLLLALWGEMKLNGLPHSPLEKPVSEPTQKNTIVLRELKYFPHVDPIGPNLRLSTALLSETWPCADLNDGSLNCIFGMSMTSKTTAGTFDSELSPSFPFSSVTRISDVRQKPTYPVSGNRYAASDAILRKMTTLFTIFFRQALLVAFAIFLSLSLVLPEAVGSQSAKRKKILESASSTGHRGTSSLHRKKHGVEHLVTHFPSTGTISGIAIVKKYEHHGVIKQLHGMLTKFPSLQLRSGMKGARKVHGRLLVSFTTQRTYQMHVKTRPGVVRLSLLSCAARISTWLAQTVPVQPYVFLRLLLIMAGDVEVNPGPKPLSVSKYDALVCLQGELKLNVFMETGLSDKLHKAAGGFMNTAEAQRVKELQGNMNQVDKVIEILKGKGNDDFHIFCKMLRESNNPVWAEMLEKKAECLRLQYMEGKEQFDEDLEAETELKRFSAELHQYYAGMKVVDDQYRRHQKMQYVNLALSNYKVDFEDDHRMFVRSLSEGVDNVYTDTTAKVEYGDILSLVKKDHLVTISGAPGTGKSTLARKLCQDASESMKSLKYKLVMMVKLSDLKLVLLDLEPSSFGMKQLMQVFGSVGSESIVQRIEKTFGADVLLILDGYDELPHELRHCPFFINLLTHSMQSPLWRCDVILTSRSIVMSEIYHHFKAQSTSFSNIEVLGFTGKQIQNFVNQYFQEEGKPELSANMSAELNSLPHIKALCSIPIVLSIISHVFLSKRNLPQSSTQIYEEFVCDILCRITPGVQSALSLAHQDHDFRRLCRIAYECTKQQKVLFTATDMEGLQGKYFGRETGYCLLTARPIDGIHNEIAESFYFIHLTVQEFLSALYIAAQDVAAQRTIWDQYLGQPHLAQTWQFYCGLTKMKCYDLLQNSSIRAIKSFNELQIQSLFEAQNCRLVASLVPHILGESVTVMPKTSYDSMAYGYCLLHHSSLRHLTVHFPGGKVVTEISQLLEPVLSSQQLQSLILIGADKEDSADWRDAEQLLDKIISQRGRIHALNGCFDKVVVELAPLSVAVKVLCLEHVQEIVCRRIQEHEVNHEVPMEVERALSRNKTIKKLKLGLLPKQFSYHLLLGIARNTTLSDVSLAFEPQNWSCPDEVPRDAEGCVQHVSLGRVPVELLPNLLTWFSGAKELTCFRIHPSPNEHEVTESDLKLVEEALAGMRKLESLTLSYPDKFLPKAFGRHVLLGISRNTALTDVELDFDPLQWDCPDESNLKDRANVDGSIQHVTLGRVPVNILPNLLTWFRGVKELTCYHIHPPQEFMQSGVGGEDVDMTEVEKALSGMERLQELVLSMNKAMPVSLMVRSGVSFLKVVANNEDVTKFVLYDKKKREARLQDILSGITPNERRRFTTGECIDGHRKYPCIQLTPASPTHHSPEGPVIRIPLLPMQRMAQGRFPFPPPHLLALFPGFLSHLPPSSQPLDTDAPITPIERKHSRQWEEGSTPAKRSKDSHHAGEPTCPLLDVD